ncbi:uncharacterized protein LOC101239439 isoform X1 [Hydra vulgaris]|uniref:uncharacterized protein LOC101239439 isoform X1 n=1 Tax=Hydra vulgaris TaxID=6087 RepID=UPI001F5F1E85|nr:uncharacterized protein LOC101239439 [Hydra vulgaris]
MYLQNKMLHYLVEIVVVYALLLGILSVQSEHVARAERRNRKFGNINGHDIFVPKSTEDFVNEHKAEENTQELLTAGIIEEGDIKVTDLFDELRNGKKSNFWHYSDDNWDFNAIPYLISPIKETSATIPACETVVDVGFILDSSGSLKNDYSNEKHFLKQLAATFSISKTGSHAAVVTFSDKATLDIKLSDCYDEISFNKAVDRIPHMNSNTRIDLALRYALKVFEESNGARRNVPKLLFLITDGKHTSNYEAENPVSVANELRNKGIDIVAIGVGKDVSFKELVSIAGSNRYVFLAEDFRDLTKASFSKRVRKESCLSGDLRNEVKLAKDNLYLTLPLLEKEFFISFELKPTFYAHGYHSVLRFEFGNGRYIAVGFENGDGTLVINSVLSVTINKSVHPDSRLTLNRWTTIKMYQQVFGSMHIYSLEVNGKLIFTKVNENPVDFTFVTVHASESRHLSQAGYFRNIKIRNGNQGFIVKHETLLKKSDVTTFLPKMEKKYVISFDIRPNGVPNSYFYNIIHLMPANENIDAANNYPSIWFNKNSDGKLNVASSTKTIYACTESCLAFNTWSKITLSQVFRNGEYVYIIKLNENIIHSEKRDNSVELENIKLYVGSSEHITHNGFIRNLFISNQVNSKSNKNLCGGLLDVVFLIDSSTNMKDNFAKVKRFMKEIAKSFGLSREGSHVSIILFGSEAKVSLKLSDNQDESTFDSACDSIDENAFPSTKVPIKIEKALQLAQKELFVQANTGREFIPKTVILITAGKQNPSKYGERVEKPFPFALELREKGVSIISVAVGSEIEKSELTGITGNIEKVFLVNNFQDLLENEFLTKVKNSACGTGLNDEQPLKRGRLIAVLPKFSKQYSVSLDIKPISYSLGVQSVLRFSIGETNVSHGFQVFAIYFKSLLGHFVVSTEINKNKNFQYTYPTNIPINKWLEVTVSQYETDENKFNFEIKLNGKQVYSVVNNHPVDHSNVKVYASDPYFPALTGLIRNFRFSNEDNGKPEKEYIVQDETPISSEKLITTIPKLGKEYEISFEVKPENTKRWFNIFRVMHGKNDKYDEERLGFWINEELKGRISSGLNSSFSFDFSEIILPHVWSNIRVSQQYFQGNYLYEVEFNDKEIFSYVNPEPNEYRNLKVFVSSPLHDTISAHIRNFAIINGYDDVELRKVVRAAINDFHDFTRVRFVPYNDQLDYLYFEPTKGCYSKIGKVGGEQPISIGDGCRWKGTVVHLIMHALGFLHETARMDRDESIEINYANMDPKMAVNFRKYDSVGQKLHQLYDYSSIMHYWPLAFSNNKLATIIPLKSSVKQDDIGQRYGFSTGDIRRINEAYRSISSTGVTEETLSLSLGGIGSLQAGGSINSHPGAAVNLQAGETVNPSIGVTLNSQTGGVVNLQTESSQSGGTISLPVGGKGNSSIGLTLSSSVGGAVNSQAEKAINLHAGEIVNSQTEGSVSLQSGEAINLQAEGKVNPSIGLTLDSSAGGIATSQSEGAINLQAGETVNSQTVGSVSSQSGGAVNLQVEGKLNPSIGLKLSSPTGVAVTSQVGGAINEQTGQTVSSQTGGLMSSQSGGTTNLQTGGKVNSSTGLTLNSLTGGKVTSQVEGAINEQAGETVSSQTEGLISSQLGGATNLQGGGKVTPSIELKLNSPTGGELISQVGGAVNEQAGEIVNSQTEGLVSSQSGGAINLHTGGKVNPLIELTLNSPTEESVTSQAEGTINNHAGEIINSQTEGLVSSQSGGAINLHSAGRVNQLIGLTLNSSGGGAVNSQAGGAINLDSGENVVTQTEGSVGSQAGEVISLQSGGKVNPPSECLVSSQAEETVNSQVDLKNEEKVNLQEGENLNSSIGILLDSPTGTIVNSSAEGSVGLQSEGKINVKTGGKVNPCLGVALNSLSGKAVNSQVESSMSSQTEKPVYLHEEGSLNTPDEVINAPTEGTVNVKEKNDSVYNILKPTSSSSLVDEAVSNNPCLTSPPSLSPSSPPPQDKIKGCLKTTPIPRRNPPTEKTVGSHANLGANPPLVSVINGGVANLFEQYPSWPFDFKISPSTKPCCNGNITHNCKCNCISIFINEAAHPSKRNYLCHKKRSKDPGFVLSETDEYPIKDCVLLPFEYKSKRFLCYSREPNYKLRWSSNPHAKNCIQYTLGTLRKKLCGSLSQ